MITASSKLDALLANPSEMWGSPEAYELQGLLLLELELQLEHASSLFNAFLQPQYPLLGCRALSAIEDDHRVIADALRDFRAYASNKDRPGLAKARERRV